MSFCLHIHNASTRQGRPGMTSLRQQMIAALQLSGKSERTQQTSVREVRPGSVLCSILISSPHNNFNYVLPRNNDDGLAPSSMRICYSALRFFYHQVVERPWQTLELMRAQTAQRPQPCSAQRSTASSRLGRLCTIASPAPPSTAVDGASTKRSPCSGRYRWRAHLIHVHREGRQGPRHPAA